jgi:hypothetical protein
MQKSERLRHSLPWRPALHVAPLHLMRYMNRTYATRRHGSKSLDGSTISIHKAETELPKAMHFTLSLPSTIGSCKNWSKYGRRQNLAAKSLCKYKVVNIPNCKPCISESPNSLTGFPTHQQTIQAIHTQDEQRSFLCLATLSTVKKQHANSVISAKTWLCHLLVIGGTNTWWANMLSAFYCSLYNISTMEKHAASSEASVERYCKRDWTPAIHQNAHFMLYAPSNWNLELVALTDEL